MEQEKHWTRARAEQDKAEVVAGGIKLILAGGDQWRRLPSGKLRICSIKEEDDVPRLYFRNHRFYQKTRSGYLIFVRTTKSGGQEPGEEEPEPEEKAIKLYYYQGQFCRQERDGWVSVEETITLTGRQHSFEE